ncbi:Rha family transcriptional regulator [Blautia producta]|uniref:Rha family transcriptional regulator n=2 Tax=Blautia producta TaxID=33035 RepID=A0A7G5N197_9FIRM|nr:Rha family transcriptional regulator [Blautia producta]QIB56589.1 Rha family transcriptional regulator [Blautia producta ATCC 27340 = DSM 2950]QIB58236.1 Rha family transcriptional regulator [Blautia producta ATCC 27340 = DSM 2950]QMW77673.1 Rha family transcriptional regulator [Blautia producta]QMW80640.1 Rha family transcriptional regulator [Blautia producta]
MLVEIKKMNKDEVTVCTSLDVAETFGKEHKNVLKDIREMDCSEEFGRLNFELSSYLNSQNKRQPMYYMTRDGFTMLVMGYTGEKAMKFKEAYIRQFNAMEKVLIGKMKEREKGIAVRQALTNALQQSEENERMHGHAYSTYTNIVYKAVFGKDAKHLREEYGIAKKENLRDYFSEEELKAVQSVEMIVSGLVNCGWGYDQIKEFVLNQNLKMLAA